jgi:hypothetical protein
MIRRNMFALLMIGLMMVPAGVAEEETPTESEAGSSSQEASPARTEQAADGSDGSEDGSTTIQLCELIGGGDCIVDKLVKIEYGPGHYKGLTCPGQTTCTTAPAIYVENGRATVGYVRICVEPSYGC